MATETAPSWLDPEAVRPSTLRPLDRLAPWGMLALLLFVISSIAAGWRYFPGFTGDHAWYLQAALRISQGEILYRDVAWAYGPLPAQALAALFRWFGPHAGWASLVSGVLTVLGVLLTYTVTRHLLSASGAFLVTAFATLAGPSVWGGLFHVYFYSYTQAITWGAVSSLAALAAALNWQKSRKPAWLAVAGLATGLAILSKPEFGLTALGTSVAALAVSRGSARTWVSYLFACGLTVALGLGIQAWSAGWWPIWRGYSGYNQLSDRLPWLWGTRLGNRQFLLGGYALWIAIAAIWAGRHWPRRRRLFFGLGAVAGLVVVAVGLSYLFGGTASALSAVLSRGALNRISFTPANLLFLVSLPWVPLVPLLLGAGWLARRRSLPAAWWALWTYALLSNLRLVLTGYASGLAVAPALAVLWVWIVDRSNATPRELERNRRIALSVLGGLALLNFLAQIVVPDTFFNQPRVQVQTAVGPVRIPQTSEEEATSLATFIDQNVPENAPIFAAGWGAQWYLLTGRPNPTAFDVVLLGLGISGPEAASVERALLTQPPEAVILPSNWQLETSGTDVADDAQRDATEIQKTMPAWWQTLKQNYVDQTPPDLLNWRVLLRQTSQ